MEKESKLVEYLKLEIERVKDDVEIFQRNFHEQRKLVRKYKKSLEEILKKFNELSDYPQIRYSGIGEITRKALEEN